MERQKEKVHISTKMEEAIKVNGWMDRGKVSDEKRILTAITTKEIGLKICEMAKAQLFGLLANNMRGNL